MPQVTLQEKIDRCEKILIGIGEEWDEAGCPEAKAAYEKLFELVKDKDYFVVSQNMDGLLYDSPFDHKRSVAPCGNVNWKQCSKACTKDIWEQDEVPSGICPHCGAPLEGNMVQSECYIEEGYMPQWKAYTEWLTRTLNRNLLVLELGVGFKIPSVIRWPFEKTAYFNKKSYLFRVHETFAQTAKEIEERSCGIPENSVEFILKESK